MINRSESIEMGAKKQYTTKNAFQSKAEHPQTGNTDTLSAPRSNLHKLLALPLND